MNEFKIGNREVKLDSDLLKFSEASINQFLSEFASHYDYYSELHALASTHYDRLKADYDVAVDFAFVKHREDGKAEKTAAAMAATDPEVTKKQDAMIAAQYKTKRLFGYIRSMDKAYESAREFCFNLRKELDKIYGSTIGKLSTMYREEGSA